MVNYGRNNGDNNNEQREEPAAAVWKTANITLTTNTAHHTSQWLLVSHARVCESSCHIIVRKYAGYPANPTWLGHYRVHFLARFTRSIQHLCQLLLALQAPFAHLYYITVTALIDVGNNFHYSLFLVSVLGASDVCCACNRFYPEIQSHKSLLLDQKKSPKRNSQHIYRQIKSNLYQCSLGKHCASNWQNTRRNSFTSIKTPRERA